MDQYDVVVGLTEALRAARKTGNEERARLLHATLAQEVHSLGLGIPRSQEVSPALIHFNGNFDTEALAALGVRTEHSR